ncbi:hypothetical protein AN958_02148, partial [Leucoagaricus sp. SymC.cos]
LFSSMSSPRVWFITGASSGFGYHLTNHVLSQGDIVVTTMRNPSSAKFFFSPSNSESESKYTDSETNKLLVLKLDVTNPVEITDAFRKAKEKYGRIDIVFNNAGVSMLGEFESTPEEKARALFETNFWGASNVTSEAVKAFRENSPPGGRLLQNTSSSALTSSPGFSFYSASKAALESISEALSQELDPAWNIKAFNLLPSFATPLTISTTDNNHRSRTIQHSYALFSPDLPSLPIPPILHQPSHRCSFS